MRIFLKLIDSNSGIKPYLREFGLARKGVLAHLKFVPYYRAKVDMYKELTVLAKQKLGADKDQRIKIKLEIEKTRDRHLDILAKLKEQM